jgi:NAD(P)-dependent dehydrogenase (short-subunit alcohol dehydrogenase family)
VNISSVIGRMGNRGQANYAASKAGLIALSQTLAKEFAGKGITVNAVAYLVSEDGNYITGQVIDINGGLYI